MPRLVYQIDLSAPPMEIAAQALVVARVQQYARQKDMHFEEVQHASMRRFRLTIPLDELNSVLDELLLAGLLHPLQEIGGKAAAHVVLDERFSTLTWVDELE